MKTISDSIKHLKEHYENEGKQELDALCEKLEPLLEEVRKGNIEPLKLFLTELVKKKTTDQYDYGNHQK